MNDDLSLRDKILLAADVLDKRTGQFSANELVVAAWKLDYKAFGLEGFAADYPDSNRVLYNLMGRSGIVQQGLLVKVGPKRYGMTKMGRFKVDRLNGKEFQPHVNGKVMAKLTKPMAEFVERCRKSEAFLLFDTKGTINFTMATRFWNMPNLSSDVKTVLREFAGRLALLDVELADEDRLLPDGSTIAAGDIRELRHVHNWLLKRFERHLDLIQSRK